MDHSQGAGVCQAEVWIDGQLKVTVDLYAPTQQWQVVKTYSGLSAGPHLLQIKVLGTKQAASTGTQIVVDAFRAPV